MKILYVEDEAHMARAVAQVLKKNNYCVDISYDGNNGLDKALTGTYDIIILDMMLPGRDGISLLRELRSQGMETPIILLTAKVDLEDKVKGLDSGADDYLAKPFDFEKLHIKSAKPIEDNTPYFVFTVNEDGAPYFLTGYLDHSYDYFYEILDSVWADVHKVSEQLPGVSIQPVVPTVNLDTDCRPRELRIHPR